jgi:hypothetical protein
MIAKGINLIELIISSVLIADIFNGRMHYRSLFFGPRNHSLIRCIPVSVSNFQFSFFSFYQFLDRWFQVPAIPRVFYYIIANIAVIVALGDAVYVGRLVKQGSLKHRTPVDVLGVLVSGTHIISKFCVVSSMCVAYRLSPVSCPGCPVSLKATSNSPFERGTGS